MKRYTILVMILIVLLLSSCTFYGPRVGPYKQTTDFYKGTQGLDAKFLNQAPPDEVFETSEFDVQLNIHNKGAFSVMAPYVARIDLTYDTDKVEPITVPTGGLFRTDYTLRTGAQLEGKNINFLEGEENYFPLERFKAKEIKGNFQQNTAVFIARLCYPYETFFSAEICVDTDTEGTGVRNQVCRKQDHTYNGQGAPLAITAVESEMIPRGAYVQPQFLITLKLVGAGTVSYREPSDYYSDSMCDEIEKEDMFKVHVDAILGDDTLSCLPEEVVLRGGEAKVQCQLIGDRIMNVASNFMTSLNVRVSYLYSETFRKDIIVKKSLDGLFEDQQKDPSDCFSWEEYDATTKRCITRCEYYAKYQNQDLPLLYKISKAVEKIQSEDTPPGFLWDSVSCMYTAVECKDNDNLCILTNTEEGYTNRIIDNSDLSSDANLCPPGDFCGLPECLLNNHAPRVSDLQNLAQEEMEWFCTDSDDKINLQRTCGCTQTAFYAFTDDDKICDDPNQMTEIQGTQTINGVRYQVDIPDVQPKFFCTFVRDNFNENATKRIRRPFDT